MLSDHEGVQSSFTKAHGFTNICCELVHLVIRPFLGGQARKSCGRKIREIALRLSFQCSLRCILPFPYWAPFPALFFRKEQRACSRAKFVKRETKDRKKCWVIISHNLIYRTKCVSDALSIRIQMSSTRYHCRIIRYPCRSHDLQVCWDWEQSLFFFRFCEGSARAWSFACLACFARRTKKKRRLLLDCISVRQF